MGETRRSHAQRYVRYSPIVVIYRVINSVRLTVESGKANSHEKCGWQTFTDSVIRVLNEKREGVIYFLWGGFAQKKGALVDLTRHTVLTCAHPSPMAGIEFNSCDHFAKANEMLASVGKAPIDWSKCD